MVGFEGGVLGNGHQGVNAGVGTGAEMSEVDTVDENEIYYLILEFLASSPCRNALTGLLNDLHINDLFPRRFHALLSKNKRVSSEESTMARMSHPMTLMELTSR